MRLFLNGEVLKRKEFLQGNYLLAENSIVNDHPYWYKQDEDYGMQLGDYGIWYGATYNGWIINGLGNLGTNLAHMVGPYWLDEVKWPTQIQEGFRFYWLSKWRDTTSDEVVFVECKCVMDQISEHCL